MITLATLAEATAQQVFDQVVDHLLTQKCQSLEMSRGGMSHTCCYRGEENCKCAAGALMTDEEWEAMGGKKINSLGWTDLIIDHDVTTKHENLIRELQNVHDHSGVFEWPDQLREVAAEFSLNTVALNKYL